MSASFLRPKNFQKLLPSSFIPGPTDIRIGRGKKCYSHAGNQRLLALVRPRLAGYSSSISRKEKSCIICEILAAVGGKFVKFDPAVGQYFEVTDFLAKEKISQTFRDCLGSQYRSSSMAKTMIRRGKRSSIPPSMVKNPRLAETTRTDSALSGPRAPLTMVSVEEEVVAREVLKPNTLLTENTSNPILVLDQYLTKERPSFSEFQFPFYGNEMYPRTSTKRNLKLTQGLTDSKFMALWAQRVEGLIRGQPRPNIAMLQNHFS